MAKGKKKRHSKNCRCTRCRKKKLRKKEGMLSIPITEGGGKLLLC